MRWGEQLFLQFWAMSKEVLQTGLSSLNGDSEVLT